MYVNGGIYIIYYYYYCTPRIFSAATTTLMTVFFFFISFSLYIVILSLKKIAIPPSENVYNTLHIIAYLYNIYISILLLLLPAAAVGQRRQQAQYIRPPV